ncbi:hypothetical protein M1L60_35895 [Actinoplanes sp. TRM 88003]|uniref:Glycosyltransferase RgtA/B/C/D-like domain-containing protein n=1 Tax=Paractinoplanes aksuensis TaxID=2939490 RepID=A0ABT1DYK7_9ACTN|nr:hypothetical protein [Actinoplanes aksuensis]MCO8275975.1 hypothetical protein [Actinoplanes aksuensis]
MSRPFVAAAVLAAALRVPFLFTGLSTDEGGYAYVAQQWSRGEALYSGVWLDRPQGLLLTYRALLGLADAGWAIRAGMVLAGVIITVALGVIAGLLVNRATGITTAFLYAVVGVAPHLEGITLNGELLAAAPATAGIALAVWWWKRERSLFWLAGAGALAGLALTMKQSGIEGVLVVGALLAVVVRRGRPALVFAAGLLLPLLASALHGLVTGWDAYWDALVGYQLSAIGSDGSNASTRWTDLGRNAGDIALDMVVPLVVSLLGWRVLDRPARRLVAAWLVAGVVGVNLGGSYWPHYFVQLLPPLVLLVAAAVTALGQRWQKLTVAAVVVLPTLIWLVALVPMSPAKRAETIPYDALAARDDKIAAVIRATTTPDDEIYVLESEAYLYFAAERRSPYPYLWGKPIDKIPDALPRLREMLDSPQRPTLVILDTPPSAVDPTGGIEAALAEHYRLDTVVEGVPILRAR